MSPDRIAEWIHTAIEFCLLLSVLGLGRLIRNLLHALHDHEERPTLSEPNPVLQHGGIRRIFRVKVAE